MYYLGIDVSKKTIDCCLISDSIFYERRFDNTEDGFRRLDDWIQEYTAEAVHCCCEATGIYHEAIAAHLRQKNIVSIVNPSKIKGFREAEQTRTKTDRQDARLIAEYCRRMQPQAWQPPTEEQEFLQAITDYIARLKQQRAAEQTKHQTAPDTIRHHIQTTIDHLNRLIATVQNELKDFYRQNPAYNEKKNRLKTIDGIGESAASALLAKLTRYDFANQNQFAAYLGLDPKIKDSGTSVKGKPRISKQGQKNARKALYMPALVAYRMNAFPAFTARLKARGKPPKLIIVAIMRKLAVIAYQLYKTGKDYDRSRYRN